MLSTVAAALITSVALGATGAVGAPEITVQVASVAPHYAPPQPVIGPEPGMSVTNAQGAQLLSVLSSLSPQSLSRFLADEGAAQRIVAAPPAPALVANWWHGLGAESRALMLSTSPELFGNLEGVPVTDRDQANRLLLSESISELSSELLEVQARSAAEQLRGRLTMLQSIESALAPTPGNPQRWLLGLDRSGQGRAAIIVGDLATADYVSVLVPGMFFTIGNQMDYWADAAERLRIEQLSWLNRLGDPVSGAGVATVAWIGYPTPNLTNVGGMDNAHDGRDSLASLIEGLRAVRGSQQPYLSIIAHSYGSTAALMALAEYDIVVDALAVVGSPGSQARSVNELGVRDGNVFVGEAAWDPVPNSSFFGSDPGAASYGATRFGVAGATDAVTGQRLAASVGHNEYFAPGTEAMRNFALIGIGRGDLVTSGHPVAKALAR